MKVFEVWTTVDEYKRECEAICDSEETALEYAKTTRNWFAPMSLYDEIQKNPEIKRFHIKERDVITMSNIKK